MTISGSLDVLNYAPSPNKAQGAAKDFEGLLIEQILKTAHTEDDDDAGAAAIGFGEDQLARALASSGGIGLAKTVEAGLSSSRQASASVASNLPVSSSGPSI